MRSSSDRLKHLCAVAATLVVLGACTLAQLSQLWAIWAVLKIIFACKSLFYRLADCTEGLRGL